MNLGIGVIGTGIMGTDHVETITASIAGAEVRAVADLDAKRAEILASRFRAQRRCRSKRLSARGRGR
jgi:predicted dehydrogenase